MFDVEVNSQEYVLGSSAETSTQARDWLQWRVSHLPFCVEGKYFLVTQTALIKSTLALFFYFPSAKRGKVGWKDRGNNFLFDIFLSYLSTGFQRESFYMSWAFGSWDANALRRRRPGSERGCGSPRGPRVRGRGYPVSIPGIPISYREWIQLSYRQTRPSSHASPLFVSLFFLCSSSFFHSFDLSDSRYDWRKLIWSY